jgi:xeroderma pigmentosum group C-complementing protein
MPPVLSRKRSRSASPQTEPPPKRARARKHAAPAHKGKVSVFQTLDTPPKAKLTLAQTKALLEQEDEDSELSDPESSEVEYEDVPLNGANKGKGKAKAPADGNSEESEDDDWEDALGTDQSTKLDHGPAPIITGDIALTLSAASKNAFDSKPDGKQGASKIQRQIRNVTHCMHVQYLMYHNLIRNAWVQDKEVQKILVEGMTAGCWRELEKYWSDAGIADGPSSVVVQKAPNPPAKEEMKDKKGVWKNSGTNGVKVYESPQKTPSGREDKKKKPIGKGKGDVRGTRKGRDWGATSEPLEPKAPNLSAGDPLLRLLKYLSAYWKNKFQVTTPSLRKRGYLSPSALEAEVNTWREDPDHPDLFGERVDNLEAFREKARKCNGSRDLGEQLFTALLRGLGIEARMIVSLQPIGFGWSQSEEGKAKNLEKLKDTKSVDDHTPSKLAATNGKAKPRSAAKKGGPSTDVDMDDSSDLSSVISISSGSEDERPAKKPIKSRNFREELPFPTYWTEAISKLTHTPVAVSSLTKAAIASAGSSEKFSDFYARGAVADKARQVLAYLIAFSSDGTAKDVTTRYVPKWPGRTKGFRMPIEKIPIHNKRGKVKRWEEWDWVKSLMRPYARPHDKRQSWDEVEDEGDLVPMQPEKKKNMDEGGKETLQGYKNSTEYVLERHLRREEALKSGAKIVRHFTFGTAGNEKSEPVYLRKDVVNCKTQESWHKEGREIREGEQPLKLVPMRAVTVTRKREIEERERLEGEKVKQGLFSKAQTDWIIPDPIVDGKIPRNSYGNIDVYVPTMVPKGAVHVPLKGTARICRKLNIDYAEACTGFEFGKQRAVPVITGVVIAQENEDMLIDAWEVEEAQKQRKERDKREKFLLGLWRRFASGLRIVDRMREEYGEDVELPVKKEAALPEEDEKEKKSQWEVFQNHTDFEGGFMRDDGADTGGGFVPEPTSRTTHQHDDMSGGFLPASQDDAEHGDLTIDHGEKKDVSQAPMAASTCRTPISLTQALQQPSSEDIEHPGEDEDENVDTSQDSEDGDVDEDKVDKEKEFPKPKPNRRRSTVASSTRGRGRARGRGAKTPTASTRKRKPIVIDSGSDDDALSGAPSEPPSPPPSTRSAPRRKAARKSDAQVKSHFFAEGSDGETDMTDMTERNSPRKKTAATRGRGSAKGRGSGRGRGRAGKAK